MHVSPNHEVGPAARWLNLEVFCLGGLSILVCLANWIFTDKGTAKATPAQLSFGLAFVVNQPHFMTSYALLYKDFRSNLLKQPRYFWSGILVPLALSVFLILSLLGEHSEWLGHAINLMFFLVGWHYVKQVFGCIIVSSVKEKLFYKPAERFLMLTNLFSLWGISFFRSQTVEAHYYFYGISYPSLNLPRPLVTISFAVFGLSTLAVVGLHIRKYINDNVQPAPGGVAALLALYVWYIPTFYHPHFAYFIPLFHSLQYLYLASGFKLNQVRARLQEFSAREWRKKFFVQFWGYFAWVLITGLCAFEFVPKALDQQKWLHDPGIGETPILAAFMLFINIHHYFIDNTIWRQSNAEVKKYLFAH